MAFLPAELAYPALSDQHFPTVTTYRVHVSEKETCKVMAFRSHHSSEMGIMQHDVVLCSPAVSNRSYQLFQLLYETPPAHFIAVLSTGAFKSFSDLPYACDHKVGIGHKLLTFPI